MMKLAMFGIEISKSFRSSSSLGHANSTRSARLAAVPVRFHGGDLDRLMLRRVEAVRVADHELQRRKQRDHADAHAQHGLGFSTNRPGQQVARAHRRNHQRRRRDRPP